MIRGTSLIRFDLKLGPLMEERFPWNFLQDIDVADVSLQLWLLKDMSKRKGEENFVYSYLQGVDMFACAYFDHSDRIGDFCVVCFFDKEDAGTIFLKSNDVKALLETASKRIKNGEDLTLVLQDLYRSLLGFVKAEKTEAVALPEEVFSIFSQVFVSLRALLRGIKRIDDIFIKTELLRSLKDLTMNLIELSIKCGGRDALSMLVQSLLEELSESPEGDEQATMSEKKRDVFEDSGFV